MSWLQFFLVAAVESDSNCKVEYGSASSTLIQILVTDVPRTSTGRGAIAGRVE